MGIPLLYNLRSVGQRWPSAVVAVLGIAGSVGVFVAMLSLARGFRATLISSGSPGNAVVRRAGSSSEMESALLIGDVRAVEDAPGVARSGSVPLASHEVVVLAAIPLRATGTDANVTLRGVSARVLDVRTNVRIARGRFLQPGLAEMVVGTGAAKAYAGLDLGDGVRLSGSTWTVVGVLDAGGSAFDSEVWCDASLLNAAYKRPPGVFQALTVRLTSPEAFPAFRDALQGDPRLNLAVERETDYFARQSRVVTGLISILGSLVAAVMGLGAVFGALNTMYAAVAERGREVATLRALGFGQGSVVASFLLESLFISLVGGLLGCLAVLPLNGLTTGTLNWQTFAHLAFAFRITPGLLGAGLAFALGMGLLGGLPPAVRAARAPVAVALRGL
jgi:putative ABC transport system permease protein